VIVVVGGVVPQGVVDKVPVQRLDHVVHRLFLLLKFAGLVGFFAIQVKGDAGFADHHRGGTQVAPGALDLHANLPGEQIHPVLPAQGNLHRVAAGIHPQPGEVFFETEGHAIVPVRGKDHARQVAQRKALGTGVHFSGRRRDEDQRLRVHLADFLGIAADKRLEELAVKVHRFAIHHAEIVGFEQLRAAGPIHPPNAVLLPGAAKAGMENAHPALVQAHLGAARPGEFFRPVGNLLRKARSHEHTLVKCGHRSLCHHLQRNLVGICTADEALRGFVEGIVAQHMGKFF